MTVTALYTILGIIILLWIVFGFALISSGKELANNNLQNAGKIILLIIFFSLGSFCVNYLITETKKFEAEQRLRY